MLLFKIQTIQLIPSIMRSNPITFTDCHQVTPAMVLGHGIRDGTTFRQRGAVPPPLPPQFLKILNSKYIFEILENISVGAKT